MTRITTITLSLALTAWSGWCQAESAVVLPKGVFNFDAKFYGYGDITERYGPNGDTEPLAIDFNGPLDSSVFPGLKALDPYVGTASLGNAVVDFTYQYRITEFQLNYGVTDQLSVGVKIPYYDVTNTVNSSLDVTYANVGKNPLYGTPYDLLQSPLVPLGIGIGETPLTSDDARALISQGIDVNHDGVIDIPGYGYKPFKTWSGSGLGDVEAGAKYKFLDRNGWLLSTAAGLRLPAGKEDDPDDLVDLGWGDGQASLLFRLYGDYLAFDKWLLNASLKYDLQFPDDVRLRIPAAVDEPLTLNTEVVDRKFGDLFELELLTVYNFTPAWSVGVKYRYINKFEDSIEGRPNMNYAALEEETDQTAQEGFVIAGYNLLKAYQEKKFAVPLYAYIEYRNRFAGSNVNKSEYIALQIGLLF